MYFLPKQLPLLDAFSLFGIALFLCHVLGELVFKTKFVPKISGYILTGFLLGPNFLNMVNNNTIKEMAFLSDISIGLVLFVIGRNLNFSWIKNDISLLFISILEFGLTLASIFCILKYSGWGFIDAFSAAIILSTISPAILLLVKEDLKAEGPIIRRALIITSFNNFLALILFSIIFPYFQLNTNNHLLLLGHSLYRIFGSILLGGLLFKTLELINYYILPKKYREQSIILIAVLMIAVWLGKALNMSVFLTLMSIGIATRNFDDKKVILESSFGEYLHIFSIPLFFITGCYLNLSGFSMAPMIIITCIIVRIASKFTAIFLFRRQFNITKDQALYLGGALIPLSGFAMGMSGKISELNPALGVQLNSIIFGCIGILGIIGPFMIQYILIKSNEAFEAIKKV